MLKWLGMGCIFLGSTGVGLLCARDLELRITELGQLQQWMLLLKGQIRHVHQPLTEAFRYLGERAEMPFDRFFSEVAEEMEARRGVSVENIWVQQLKGCKKMLHLTEQEIRDLGHLGCMLGKMDVEMQLNAVDYYMEQLALSLKRAQEAVQNRKRLYQYMGILGGLALCILIF